ncbi:MAG: [FeFe] hydrogenase H-cluster radical SAM maturase HydG [Alphaproteobacteria bacterium]|nr:[FeFe] hydrogenase H-cluster radical SAM maturase HydG [Alphaproteobacteria bacterium]
MTHSSNAATWLDSTAINETLNEATNLAQKNDKQRLRELLAKAGEAKGLDSLEVALLMQTEDQDILDEMYALAKKIKEQIYGRRIVLFAPMYVSNLCKNECLYCAFRAKNKDLTRRALTGEEIENEARILVNQGHKRTLIVAGESYPAEQGFDYIIDAINRVYAVKGDKPGAEIRRVNVNLAPLSVEDFKRLEDAKIGTYQAFQETYDRSVYAQVHTGGKKRDFDWRVTVMDRAMEAGIGDVGMGVLYGLADWRFDTLALLKHVKHLEETFGIGCHTLSVPRLEPAHGSELASHSKYAVSDHDFKKIVTILRLAVPYTGMIMSTREDSEMRQATLELGVSQISAGSRTNPGGYAEAAASGKFDESQFQLGDHRPLDEVIKDLTERGFIPSNCTACDQLGRMGEKFMPFVRSGKIKNHCTPNALSTFLEYLIDYASPETKKTGQALIASMMESMPESTKQRTQQLLDNVNVGQRGCLC